MPRWHPSYCYRCKRHRSEAGRISARGNCAECGDTRMLDNLHQLEAHDGEFFDWWRERLLAAFGAAPQPRSERMRELDMEIARARQAENAATASRSAA